MKIVDPSLFWKHCLYKKSHQWNCFPDPFEFILCIPSRRESAERGHTWQAIVLAICLLHYVQVRFVLATRECPFSSLPRGVGFNMTLAKIRTDEKGNLFAEKALQCCFKDTLTSSCGKTAAAVTVFCPLEKSLHRLHGKLRLIKNAPNKRLSRGVHEISQLRSE